MQPRYLFVLLVAAAAASCSSARNAGALNDDDAPEPMRDVADRDVTVDGAASDDAAPLDAAPSPDLPAPLDAPPAPPPPLPPTDHLQPAPGSSAANAFLRMTMCSDPTTRATLGALSAGWVEIGVRARIARSGTGVAAADAARVALDLTRLNQRYEPYRLRFSLRDNDVATLANDAAMFDDLTTGASYAWNTLCAQAGEAAQHVASFRVGSGAAARPLFADAMPMLYVHGVQAGAAGFGGSCGLIVATGAGDTDETWPVHLTHEAGHYFGLEHTHQCLVSVAMPGDPNLTGDRIPDTPEDRGPTSCVGNPVCQCQPMPGVNQMIPSDCTQAGDCVVTCPGGVRPDGRNFMSYYRRTCLNRFTDDQALFLRCVARAVLGSAQVCPVGQIVCAGACVDVATNPAHCGSCGSACGAGRTCTGGACVCGAGLTACSGSCVDLRADRSNCGACGVSCGVGGTCSGGNCVCPIGQVLCGGRCAPVEQNCGACGTACGAGDTCANTCPGSCLRPLLRCCYDIAPGTACRAGYSPFRRQLTLPASACCR